MKNLLTPAILTIGLLLTGVAVTGCASTADGGRAIQNLEEMSDLDYAKWQLYITLGVKVGAGRLLDEGAVSASDLKLAATALDLVISGTPQEGATSLIIPALEEVGLTSDEVQLLLLVAEQELLARGALDLKLDAGGVLGLSPRTKEVLALIADSLRGAVAASESGYSLDRATLQTQFPNEILTVIYASK